MAKRTGARKRGGYLPEKNDRDPSYPDLFPKEKGQPADVLGRSQVFWLRSAYESRGLFLCLAVWRLVSMLLAMEESSESPLDQLWREYGQVFRSFDDLTLARWISQTLGQLEGRVWRLSHPLMGAYRLAAQQANDRHIALGRLVTIPRAYLEAPCCGAPMLPLLTRDVLETGLVCQNCSGTAVPFDEIPAELKPLIKTWADEYTPVHAVAHWDDRQRRAVSNYDRAYEQAAQKAETLLAFAGAKLLPAFLDHYPAVVWEDQDECLEVRPEDVVM